MYVAGVITSAKTRPIPPLKCEKKFEDELGGPSNISKNLALRIS
jgi:hypothetical protein